MVFRRSKEGGCVFRRGEERLKWFLGGGVCGFKRNREDYYLLRLVRKRGCCIRRSC
jgi:hypothetical protein